MSFAGIGVVLLCFLVAVLLGFPAMGVPASPLLVPLVFSIIDENTKVSEYEQALQRYQQRRAALLAQAEPERPRSGAVETMENGVR